ncbi:hypothetical protein [Cupriavidus laharis]|nr:hypothetical protein [Cupriavidus laharis]
MTLSAYAETMLQVFDESSLKTDAGVQAVMTYLLAYPGQTIGDLASATGFDETRMQDYLSALGDLVELRGATWSASARGRSAIEHLMAVGTGRAKGARPSSTVGLTAAEAKRWEEVKRIVMDTPVDSSSETLREQYEHWFRFAESNPPKTVAEVDAVYTRPKPGEAEAHCTFGNQGSMGITIHRPGTQPVVDFGSLLRHFRQTDDDSLVDSDGSLIEKALGLGLTFW